MWTSFWSLFDQWSGVSRARKQYDCDHCPFPIHRRELYKKEVFRMWECFEIFRTHVNCPTDPDELRYHEECEGEDSGNWIEVGAEKLAA